MRNVALAMLVVFSCAAAVHAQCPQDAPVLTAPARGATLPENMPVTFKWTAVSGASGYTLHVTPDHGQTFQVLVSNTTSTEHAATLPRGDWGWTVFASFPGDCPPVHAEPSHFFIGCDQPAPQLLSPAHEATNVADPVLFEWQAVQGASFYRLWVSKDGAEPALIATTTGTQFSARMSATVVDWTVEAVFDGCPSRLGEPFRFTMTSCASGPVQLQSPPDGATGVSRLVKFAWSPVPKASGYFLLVSVGSDPEFKLYGTTAETSIEKSVPEGTIRWLVVATIPGCPEIRSTVFTFQTAARNCPTGTIALHSPAAGATVSSPIQLSWSAIENAAAYRVWAWAGNGAPVNIARTTTTSAAVTLPAGTFTWYVEALIAGCTPILSPQSQFIVATAANCDANPAATLVSPAGTADAPAEASSPVELRWNPAHGAAAYRVWLARVDKAFEDIALTTGTSATATLEPGIYKWFVQSLFANCPPVPSAVAFFAIPRTTARCGGTAPSIVAPGPGSTVTSPVTFRWSAVEGAEKYRLYASLDGSDPQLIGVTTETSLTRALPPGTVPWTVEAVFENCPSHFAPRSEFTIAKSENCTTDRVQLVSPANGSSATAGPIDFTWSPVAGAVRYVLIARHEDGTATPVADTTGTQVTRRVPPGRLEWVVAAFFPGCDPTFSERFHLDVTIPEGCSRVRPVIIAPSGGSPSARSPVHLAWTRVAGATGYDVWAATGGGAHVVIASTTDNEVAVELSPGTYDWYVEARFANCPSTESAHAELTVRAPLPCGTPSAPVAQVVGQAVSGTAYTVRWTPLPNVQRYELQESTTLDFENAQTFTVSEVRRRFTHDVSAPTQYLYRVRGISDCNDERGPFSDVVGVVVVPPQRANPSAELGTQETIVQKVFLPGSTPPVQFTATIDKPWLTVTPSSGTLPPEGMTLVVTADPSTLPLGTNTGTITVSYTAASGAPRAHSTTVVVPVSVSLVTPVTPTGKSAPPPDALIFGAVGHAVGQNDSLFESDVRVTNLGAQTRKYQVNYTPSATDGTTTGSSTTIEIAPNGTVALDDIVASLFGLGETGGAVGMLEVRPLTTSSSSTGYFSTITTTAQEMLTLGSSRTYNFTPNGTFGQFIPPTPFAKFVGRGTILSLMQVAQSAQYRSNFGFLEASGLPVELVARAYDVTGELVATIPIYLQSSEHQQHNLMLALNGVNDLADGRVEVEVTGGDGKITAYVSSVDNQTNDPLLVSAVEPGTVSASRYVIPGMAHADLGFAFWVSDMRIFNAGTAPVTATLTFYSINNPGDFTVREVELPAGRIVVLDDVVSTLFGKPNGAGGSVVITTPQPAPLHVTSRTYNKTTTGTYGQYIPAVTVAESVGAGDRALQILQVEQSSRFRTNIGINETTGQPVTVEVSLVLPDSLVTPVVTHELAANEYRQFGVADFGIGEAVYNGRVTVKAVGGTGKVTAYGSLIDMTTNDPAYIPAQ